MTRRCDIKIFLVFVFTLKQREDTEMRKSTILLCPEFNPDTWANLTADELQSATFLFDRGYTGHEHLDAFGIINMNGRLYDPYLGRMLSPDNFVQNPDYSQNYNRYSYAYNNPLKYTDPNGEIVWFVPIIYAAVNVTVDLIMNDFKMNIGEIAQSAVTGAVAGFLGGGGITTVGQALLSASISQVNRFMPSVPIYQSDNMSISISPMIGYGTSGFTMGGSINLSGQIDDFAFAGSVGIGYNSGVSSLGENVGAGGYWNAGGFVGYYDGHSTYGAGYSYNTFGGKMSQGVGAIHLKVGDFSLRFDEDYLGDHEDRYRTGGLLMTYKVNDDITLAFGGSMMTGNAKNQKIQSPEGNPNVTSGGNMYTNEDYKIRGGTMYGGIIYKGQAYFAGHNSEKRLHDIQNWIHRHWPIHDSPYFPNLGLPSRAYRYYGSYHPLYLYY